MGMHLPARALTRLPPAPTSMGLNCAWGIVACAGWGHLLVERVGGAHTVHVRVRVCVFVFVFVCSCVRVRRLSLGSCDRSCHVHALLWWKFYVHVCCR